MFSGDDFSATTFLTFLKADSIVLAAGAENGSRLVDEFTGMMPGLCSKAEI